MANTNKYLQKNKETKNDEFYTYLEDIEKELSNYNLEGKTIYCCCDDWRWSNFIKYFVDNYNTVKFKRLISSYYAGNNKVEVKYYDNENGVLKETTETLNSNGDFVDWELLDLFNQADVVVTNPPFSLLRELLERLEHLGKKFIMITPMTAMDYNQVFYKLKKQEYFIGHNIVTKFYNEEKKLAVCCCWLTNFKEVEKENLGLIQKDIKEYEFWDGCDVLEVPSIRLIPEGYEGMMGVPVNFLLYWNKHQFELIEKKSPKINNKTKFKRIIIKKIKN